MAAEKHVTEAKNILKDAQSYLLDPGKKTSPFNDLKTGQTPEVKPTLVAVGGGMSTEQRKVATDAFTNMLKKMEKAPSAPV